MPNAGRLASKSQTRYPLVDRHSMRCHGHATYQATGRFFFFVLQGLVGRAGSYYTPVDIDGRLEFLTDASPGCAQASSSAPRPPPWQRCPVVEDDVPTRAFFSFSLAA